MIGRVNEIFPSIQGEGVYFGERQVFVRFSGCNLSCNYCDTDFNSYREYRPDSLLSRIKSFDGGIHSVSFTGGEPLLQKDFLKEALRLVKAAGYTTYLETNGTLSRELNEVIAFVDIIAMDVKLPSSASLMRGYWQEHRDFLRIAVKKNVFIKAVISQTTTHDDFVMMLGLLNELGYTGVLVIQPSSFDHSNLLEDKLASFKRMAGDYLIASCVIPQMHKIMGVR